MLFTVFGSFYCSNFVSLWSTFFAVVDLNGCPEEQILNGSQPDMDEAIPCDNLDDEPAQMVEELHSGIDNDEEANLLMIFALPKSKQFFQKNWPVSTVI